VPAHQLMECTVLRLLIGYRKQHRMVIVTHIVTHMECIYDIKLFLLFTKLCPSDLINKDETNTACDTNGGKEKYTQSISRET
jgi:hypothetical protein